MRVLVQRSSKSSVSVENETTGKIEEGLVLFIGFTEGDSLEKIQYLAKKVVNLRIFPDENDVMNRSLLENGGSILSISQFTLYADTKKGNRPSYINAMSGEKAITLYEQFNEELKKYVPVETGRFGEHMIVSITNVGPITILLEK